MSTPLIAQRQEAADLEFQNYDFGDSEGDIVDAGGWGHTSPGVEWTRALYIDGEQASGPSIQANFVVVFENKDSAEVKGAYCSLNGNDIGKRGTPTPNTDDTHRM